MRYQITCAVIFALCVAGLIWVMTRQNTGPAARQDLSTNTTIVAAVAGQTDEVSVESPTIHASQSEETLAEEARVGTTNMPEAETPWVKDELIVRVGPQGSLRAVMDALASKGFVTLRRVGALGLLRVKVPEGMGLEEAEALLREMEGVEGSERNYWTELPREVGELPLLETGMPLAPVLRRGREMVGLNNPAGEVGYGRNCFVALLDTGVDATHPDLMHCILNGYNFVDDNGDTRDLHGHGTACAGIIAGNGLGATSVKGIAPKAYVIPVKVLDASGRGTAFDVVEGLLYAVERGARVINLSLSARGESAAVRDALQYVRERGAIVVAAAGNEGFEAVGFPGNVPHVISVGAVDGNWQRAPFSNYGEALTMVAPGVAVYTTARERGYMQFSGTSAAAPFVAGALAALIGSRSSISAEEAYHAAVAAADTLGRAGHDPEYGYGIINVRRLLYSPNDKVYDVALSSIYFNPPRLQLGMEAEVHFVIQNRGTRAVRGARVVTRVGGESYQHWLEELAPSQAVEVSRRLVLPASMPEQPLRVEGVVMLRQADAEPHNNGRAVTLHPSVWKE